MSNIKNGEWEKMTKEKIESVRSLERGFKILECFTEHVTLSLTEIIQIYQLLPVIDW